MAKRKQINEIPLKEWNELQHKYDVESESLDKLIAANPDLRKIGYDETFGFSQEQINKYTTRLAHIVYLTDVLTYSQPITPIKAEDYLK